MYLLLPITMNFMMTMTAMQTSRSKRLIKMLERLISKDYLYTDDQIKEMKLQLRVIKEELAENKVKRNKGFGK